MKNLPISPENVRVYNPFSVLYYLKDRKRANYWFESGTPYFLVELLKKEPTVLETIENKAVTGSTLGAFEVGKIPLITILYQTGCLTIKEYDSTTDTYILGFPNEEVRLSVFTYLMTLLTHVEKPEVENALFYLRKTLESNNIQQFCNILRGLLANIPYHLHIPRESYYHSLFAFMGNLLGLDIQSEVSSSHRRIDMILTTPERIFIFEFKFEGTGKEALDQIT